MVRALASHARGHRFESYYLHHLVYIKKMHTEKTAENGGFSLYLSEFSEEICRVSVSSNLTKNGSKKMQK